MLSFQWSHDVPAVETTIECWIRVLDSLPDLHGLFGYSTHYLDGTGAARQQANELGIHLNKGYVRLFKGAAYYKTTSQIFATENNEWVHLAVTLSGSNGGSTPGGGTCDGSPPLPAVYVNGELVVDKVRSTEDTCLRCHHFAAFFAERNNDNNNNNNKNQSKHLQPVVTGLRAAFVVVITTAYAHLPRRSFLLVAMPQPPSLHSAAPPYHSSKPPAKTAPRAGGRRRRWTRRSSRAGS